MYQSPYYIELLQFPLCHSEYNGNFEKSAHHIFQEDISDILTLNVD